MAANEPRSYREAFVWVFEAVRPHVKAIAVEPGALDRETLRIRPDLVVCDRATPHGGRRRTLLDPASRGRRGAGG